jgi:hypothetical protein
MSWWQEQGRDIRIYVRDMLCDDCRETIRDYGMDDKMDAVDEATAEITQVDVLWHCLGTCCGLKPDFIGPNTPIIEAVFRTFLLNNNTPLSIRELHERLDRRPPETLLRMLTAGNIYLGLRPIRE